MVSDQEPRYRLVDDEGNIVGSLYGKADGSVAIQETDSGSDREVALAPDGTFSAPSVETESVNTEVLDIGTGASNIDSQSIEISNDIAEIPIPSKTTVELRINEIAVPDTPSPTAIQFSEDGGETFGTDGNYQYTREQIASDATDRSAEEEDQNEIILMEESMRGAATEADIRIYFSNPGLNDRTVIRWEGGFRRLSSRVFRLTGAGHYEGENETDTVRLFNLDDGSPSQLESLNAATISYDQS